MTAKDLKIGDWFILLEEDRNMTGIPRSYYIPTQVVRIGEEEKCCFDNNFYYEWHWRVKKIPPPNH